MYIFEDFLLIFQVLRAGYTINVHCSNLYFIIYHKTYNDELGFEIIRKKKNIRNNLNYTTLRHILHIYGVG